RFRGLSRKTLRKSASSAFIDFWNRLMCKMYHVLLVLGLTSGAITAAEPHAYRAARLLTGDGQEILNAVLVVQDGKVVAVGYKEDLKISGDIAVKGVKVPEDAVVHDLGDAVIIPGLIAAETTLAEKGRDDLHALTPHHRAIDGFDPYADYSAI